MERRKLRESFNSAIEGFVFVLKTQRNMRLHFIISVLVIFAGIFLQLSKIEMLMLTTAIAFVLLAEMFNTAIELVIDLITDTFHPLARIIKDVTAGCVLIASINAVVVGYLIFARFFFSPTPSVDIMWLKQTPWNITFLSLLLVLFLVIVSKTFLGKGEPLRGGMPSGHSAVAFSIWTMILLNTNSKLLIILSFFLAVLVAQSRVKAKIHTMWEIILGGLLGILVTALLFRIFG